MRRAFRLLLLLALPALVVACGSSGADDGLFGNADGTGGATEDGGLSAGAGGAPGGGRPGGGAPSAGGSGAPGGATSAGGSGAPGGATSAGGTVMVPDGGTPVVDGGTPTLDGAVGSQIPTGIFVSERCVDCLAAECPTAAAACEADPACLQGIACLNTCIFPPLCAACFLVSGVTSVPAPIPPLNACASQSCTMCPTLG